MKLSAHDIKAIHLATLIAEKGEFKHKHGAVIYHKSQIISKGFNRNKTHPKAQIYPYPYIHAELDAVIKASDVRGADIAVVRLNKSKHLMSSCPCKYCMEMLIIKGIRYLIFSSTTGINKIKLN